MSQGKPPFVVRWRNGVMDDPNPALTWRALVAAMPLVRHANVTTGRDCFPGAASCARQMRVSVDTIKRGWAELVEAGWLEIKPLPANRRKTQGALKLLRWPAETNRSLSAMPLSAAQPVADSYPTFTGNQEARSAAGGRSAAAALTCGQCGGTTTVVDGVATCDGECFWSEVVA